MSETKPWLQRIAAGNAFQAVVQTSWSDRTQYGSEPVSVKVEKSVIRVNGKGGRIDVFVELAEEESHVAVLEIKFSDWEANWNTPLSDETVRKRVARQAAQVRSYTDALQKDSWQRIQENRLRQADGGTEIVEIQSKQENRDSESAEEDVLPFVTQGVIFPQRPSDSERLDQIEHLFAEYLIGVVWEDETIAERARRSGLDIDSL